MSDEHPGDESPKLKEQMGAAFGIVSLPVAIPSGVVGGVVSVLRGGTFEEGFDEYGDMIYEKAAAFGRRNAKVIKDAAIFATVGVTLGSLFGVGGRPKK